MIGRDISAVRSHGQYWSSCQMKNFLGNSRGESFLQPPPSMCPDDDDIDLKFVRQCFQCIPDFALAQWWIPGWIPGLSKLARSLPMRFCPLHRRSTNHQSDVPGHRNSDIAHRRREDGIQECSPRQADVETDVATSASVPG